MSTFDFGAVIATLDEAMALLEDIHSDPYVSREDVSALLSVQSLLWDAKLELDRARRADDDD